MLSQRPVNIGGDEIILQQFSTTKGLKYGIAVGKIAGAMLVGGLEGDLNADPDDPLGGLDAGKMVEGFMSELDIDATPALIKSMIQDAVVAYQFDGKTFTSWDDTWYEARFAGALVDLAELLVAIFEDNFVETVAMVKKKAAALRGTTPKPSSDSTAEDNGATPALESTRSFFELSPGVPAR